MLSERSSRSLRLIHKKKVVVNEICLHKFSWSMLDKNLWSAQRKSYRTKNYVNLSCEFIDDRTKLTEALSR